MNCEYPDCIRKAYRVLIQKMKDGKVYKTPMCKKHWKGYKSYVKERAN